jgi:heme-degrading monooxygenase HmoA
MILEIAILYIRNGQKESFERDFAIASKYISSIKGYINHNLQKCIEQENKYILLVNWEKIEDHTIGFRQSEVYQDWKNLLHHYYDPFPIVEHFEKVL